MKTTFLLLMLTGLSAWAQLPASPATNAPSREELLRRFRRPVPGQPDAPLAGPAAATTPGSAAAPAANVGGNAVPAATGQPPMISIPPSTKPPEEIIPAGMIDFRAVELNEVLKIYANLVQRTILRPANLGTMQIVLKTQTDLTKSEAIQAIDAVLALNGITMINFGEKFVKAVPVGQANTEGAPPSSLDATNLPDLGQYVTHVVQLKYAKPSELLPALQPFAKIPNSILPIDSSGILVIRDFTENVKRMLEMIARIDATVPSEFLSEVIPIKYAKASEIADALNSLGGTGGGGTMGGTRSGTSTQRPGGLGTGGLNRGGFGGAGGYAPGSTPFGGTSGVTPGAAGVAGGAAAGTSFTDRLQNLIHKASTSGDLQLFGQMKILADERSNSLLVFASRQDMEMIKNVIAKLDVVLAQVLIETAILSVSIGHDLSYGISAGQPPRNFGGKTTVTSTTTGTGTNAVTTLVTNIFGALGSFGGVANGGGSLGSLANFFTGVASGSNSASAYPSGSGLSYFGRYTGNLDVAVQALLNDSRVNVIQRPQILTTHAKPGSIFVGNTVPYITSSSYGGAYGAGNSYQQLSVGVGLQVTPYINQDGLVVMQIDETIDELGTPQHIDNVGDVPTTSSRRISAEVAVRDRETIILGGFIRNSSQRSSSGVPILMDIPILGNFFKSKTSNKDRDELLVMMRPKVLKTPELAAIATTEEKKHLPGILRAEAEIQTDEDNQLDADKKVMLEEQKRAAKRKKTANPADDANYSKPPVSAPQ